MTRRWLVLLLAATSTVGPARAEDLAAATAAEVRFVDLAPAGPSVADRLREIRERIQAAVVYPPLARRDRLEGEVLVRFEVGRDGAAHEIQLARTSGRPTLDRAAARAVARAVPLPWVYGRLEVPVRFELTSRDRDASR